jgi:hypothetical protein
MNSGVLSYSNEGRPLLVGRNLTRYAVTFTVEGVLFRHGFNSCAQEICSQQGEWLRISNLVDGSFNRRAMSPYGRGLNITLHYLLIAKIFYFFLFFLFLFYFIFNNCGQDTIDPC